MYQLLYASISQTHYWHEVGMLYLFTMVVAPPAGTLYFHLFCTITRASVCCVHAICEYQQNTCTSVNMHSGKMDAHPAVEKFNAQHAPKSLCLKKNQNTPRSSEHPPVLKEKSDLLSITQCTVLLFHCCTGKGAKTKLHQEYPHRKKRIPPLSRKLVFFCELEHPKKHATLR